MKTLWQNFPPELTALRQWVNVHEGSKVPMQSDTEDEPASSSNPDTWSDFETARDAYEEGWYENIGFVFHHNGLVGIDIDVGYDEDGLPSALACDIIGKCQSYTERSRSGRGFHILLKGDLPFKGKNNQHGVEIYKDARYFIMTGQTMLYGEIRANQEAIDYLLSKYFPETTRDSDRHGNPGKVYQPEWELPRQGWVQLRPSYPRIPSGARNICLTSLAGMMHTQGFPPQQIYEELTNCNVMACDPCLPDAEVQTIVQSVTRYIR